MILFRENTSGVLHLNQIEYKNPWSKLKRVF